MALKTDWIRYGKNREHLGFAAWMDQATQLPAVVVIQEAWGVNAHIEDVACRFAKAGYFAFAPDLFSQSGERPAVMAKERMAEVQAFVNTLPPAGWWDAKLREAELAKRPKAEAERLGESFGVMLGLLGKGLEPWLPALTDATAYLRRENALTRGQKVGSVGFCMGGGLSAQLACSDPELAAAVIFYGTGPAAEKVPAIRCPVLGLYGGLDKRILDGLPAFTAAMKEHGKAYEPVVYEGAQHAFFNDTRPTYHPAAARDAFVRTLALFRDRL